MCLCACSSNIKNSGARKLIKHRYCMEYTTNYNWETYCLLYWNENDEYKYEEWTGYINEWRIDNTRRYNENEWLEFSGNYIVLIVGTWERT